MRNPHRILFGNPEGYILFGVVLGVDRSTISKNILKKLCAKIRAGFIWLKIRISSRLL
jgi:hypothetical protein